MLLTTAAAGLSTFLLSLVVHVLWWRARRPPADIKVILWLFLWAPTLLYVAVAAAGALGLCAFMPDRALLALVLHAAFSSVYVQTYSAAQARSPTLYIMLAVADSSHGLDEAGIARSLDARELVDERTGDLLRNGLLERQGPNVALSRPGRLMASWFRWYRRWLGLSPMGG